MTTIADMARRWARVDLIKEMEKAIGEDPDFVLNLNRDQLKHGLARDGKLLTPSILDDPFFKSRRAAAAYAGWKKRLGSEAPYGTPDLFIVGVYYDSLKAKAGGGILNIESTVGFGQDINTKYKGQQTGLTDESKKKAWAYYKPKIVQSIKYNTGT